jgi:hypothetical protein
MVILVSRSADGQEYPTPEYGHLPFTYESFSDRDVAPLGTSTEPTTGGIRSCESRLRGS